MTKRKKILLLAGVAPALFVLYILSVLAMGTITDFKPPAHMTIQGTETERERVREKDTVSDTLSLLTWNIGYAGLGAEMDFFYDGGKQVEPKKEWHEKYLKGIGDFLASSHADFLLIQEADTASARSYHSNEFRILLERLKEYEGFFAINYLVKFVPTPIFHPMGGTAGGLITYSRYHADTASRFDYPGDFAWPKQMYLLDRCMLLNRFPTADGKELVLINTHNSAYDSDGSMKRQELAFIREILLNEYKKGNYVIVGGDWNQAPPFHIGKGGKEADNIPADYLPEDWVWAYDPTQNTNRSLKTVYDPEKTPTSLIDFFLISPNVTLLSVKTHPLAYQCSDHNPVSMRVTLKKPASLNETPIE